VRWSPFFSISYSFRVMTSSCGLVIGWHHECQLDSFCNCLQWGSEASILLRLIWKMIVKTGVCMHACRLKKGKELRKEEDLKEVEQNMHIIRAPAGMIAGIVILFCCINVEFFVQKLHCLLFY